MIGRFIQWRRQVSLANTLALWAAGIALTSVVMVAGLSLAIIYRIETRAQASELRHKSHDAVNSLAEPIRVVERSLAELARGTLFTDASVDTEGRADRRFIQGFRFPIAARSGLAWCDRHGRMLAATPELAGCRADSPLFQRVLADGQSRRTLLLTPAGAAFWVIFQGVGRGQGVAVAQIALDDLLRPLPGHLNLHRVSLRLATPAPADQAPAGELPGVWTVSLLDDADAVEGGIPQLRLEADPPSLGGLLAPLFTGYTLASLLLLGLALVWARHSARRLTAPLLALRDKAEVIAAGGDLSLAMPTSGVDEIGQLAASIDTMVQAIRRAEATRAKAETRFKRMFETSSEAIVFSWPDGRVEAANREAVRLFGFNLEELRAQGRAGFMDADDPRLPSALEQRSRSGAFRGELRCRRRDGSLFPVEVVSTIFRDADGELRSSSMFRDISGLKRAEADLKRYQDIVSSMPDAVALFDQAGRYVMINPAYETLVNAEDGSLIGRSPEDHLGADFFHDQLKPGFDLCLLGETVTLQDWLKLSGAGQRFVTMTCFPSRDAANRITGVVLIARDITDRKQTNDALQDSLASLRLREDALAAISQGVLISGPDKRITYVSDAFERITGYAAGDVLGRSCSLIQGPDTDPASILSMRAALAAGQPFHGEILNYRKDGSSFWNDLSITPVFDADGRLSQFVGVVRDVSERKAAEQTLQASRGLIKTVFDSLDEQVVVLDPEAVILAANQAWRRFGRERGAPGEVIEGVGCHYLDTCFWLVGPSQAAARDEVRAGIAAVLAGTRPQFNMEYPCHTPGKPGWFNLQALALQGPQRGAVVLHEDITARIEGAKRLKALSAGLVEFQETARRHLAGELHDRTSANLAAIMINMDVTSMALEVRDWRVIAERMADNRVLIDDTTASIREICAELRPPVLDYAGLIPAVEAYANLFTRRTGVAVTVNCLGRDTALAPDIESTLFRIVQEALTNVAKHALARQVQIDLYLHGEPLCLNIADDGRGFDPLAVDPAPGLGIINMREMVEFVGGRFELDTALRQGTRIHVEIDLVACAEEAI